MSRKIVVPVRNNSTGVTLADVIDAAYRQAYDTMIKDLDTHATFTFEAGGAEITIVSARGSLQKEKKHYFVSTENSYYREHLTRAILVNLNAAMVDDRSDLGRLAQFHVLAWNDNEVLNIDAVNAVAAGNMRATMPDLFRGDGQLIIISQRHPLSPSHPYSLANRITPSQLQALNSRFNILTLDQPHPSPSPPPGD